MFAFNFLRHIKISITRYLAKRIIVQLDADDRAFLATALLPELNLSMGIAVPLASPLTTDVYVLTVRKFLHQHCNELLAFPSARALDLGCGLTPKNPFQASSIEGVDIRGSAESRVVVADLFNGSIPFEDDAFDFVTAFDFIEHVPRVVCEGGSTRFPFVQLMDEVARVLKPDGIFFSSTPAFPSQQVFQDPTHVNTITENTFPLYFCQRDAEVPLARMYGFRSSFVLVSQQWSGCSLLTLMKKVDWQSVT